MKRVMLCEAFGGLSKLKLEYEAAMKILDDLKVCPVCHQEEEVLPLVSMCAGRPKKVINHKPDCSVGHRLRQMRETMDGWGQDEKRVEDVIAASREFVRAIGWR